jgi:hypothetical protein
MKDDLTDSAGLTGPTAPDDAEDGQLDALVRSAAAARSARLDGHPDPSQLADYCLDALEPGEQEKIREHLPLCAACAQVVLDLKAIAAPPAAGGAAAEPAMADLESEWRRLEARLAPAAEGRRARRPPAPASWRGSWALAASLLLSVGLLAWGIDLRRDLDRARQPGADVALVDLAPLGKDPERSVEGPKQVPATAAIRHLLLQLDLGEVHSFRRYDMRLLAPGGKVAWQQAGVRRDETGSFLLEIPRETLSAPGLYRVEIAGVQAADAPGAAPVPLAAYEFVVPAGTPSTSTR